MDFFTVHLPEKKGVIRPKTVAFPSKNAANAFAAGRREKEDVYVTDESGNVVGVFKNSHKRPHKVTWQESNSRTKGSFEKQETCLDGLCK